MAQILFYTDEAKIERADLRALRKAGIVPIRVADMSAAKFAAVEPHFPISGNELFLAAMKSIVAHSGDATKAKFIALFTTALERHVAIAGAQDRPDPGGGEG